MALNSYQIESITILLKKGGMSNRKIADEVGCSESAVRGYIKKNGIQKNALKDLAEREITNTIIAKEINEEKNALTDAEKTHYTELLLTEAQSRNLVMNANQKLLMKIYDDIENGMKVEKINVGEGVQQFEPVAHGSSDHVNHSKAIQTISDNLGITNRHAPKSDVNVNQQQAQQQNTKVSIVKRSDSN